jgi:hypothetical protein
MIMISKIPSGVTLGVTLVLPTIHRSDLLGALLGQPWSHPLYVVSKSIPLYGKLREERLVPDDLDAVLSTFSKKFQISPSSNSLYIK